MMPFPGVQPMRARAVAEDLANEAFAYYGRLRKLKAHVDGRLGEALPLAKAFERAFKKWRGMTPRDFKRSVRPRRLSS